MAPKGGPSKWNGPPPKSLPTPLSLYKRGLAAVRSWSPLTSAASDAEAVTALAASCLELQTIMGLRTQLRSDATSTTGASRGATSSPSPPTASTGCGANCTPGPDVHMTTYERQSSGGRGKLSEEEEGEGNGAADGCNGGSCGGDGAASGAEVGSGPGGGGWADGSQAAAGAAADPLGPEVWAALAALEPGMESYSAVVRHSLDLGFEDWRDEPGFLLASCHLELAKLLGRFCPRREVVEQRHLEAALALFPDFVAAGVALGQALLARADHPQQLQQAEVRLRRAVAVADRLAGGGERDDKGGGGDDGDSGNEDEELLLEANAACRREWEAGAAARRSLAMLLCQAGRDGEAAPLLAALNFTHRLAMQVLHYPLDPLTTAAAAAHEAEGPGDASTSPSGSCCPGPAPDPSRYVQVVDGALPAALLHVLRSALVPGGRFWAEHGYGRVGYFSYMHQLGSPALSAIHDAAVLLHRLIVPRFPAAAEARYAEWWAHCRRHPSGHQLHFDSDDEGLGGVRNPIVSGVIFLTGRVGGPTLVTTQLLGGPLAQHGWLVHPQENRLAVFDSTVLHGVIPGRGPSPRPGEYRITLMIAFWRDIKCRPREDGLPGPSQPFPSPSSPAARRYSWMADLQPHPDGPDGWGTADPQDVAASPIHRVWERLDGGAAQPGAVQYDACFQGF